MIDKATIDRIFAAANIVEVVSDFVQLRKKGVNYQACCPFHSEKTPSFVVSPSKGMFKCFGCGKGGNAVTFVMEHENMTYPEALKYVGRKYGIEVQERELTPEEQQRNDDRESMMILNSFATDYFRNYLRRTDEGQSVGMSYFRSRGFTDATIEKFQLGFCPAAGDTFTRAALEAGYREQFLTGTGLSIRRDDGSWLDRFFGRVMFPIHSISGRVIAFGGRVLRTDRKSVAKYQNSPESDIYSKKRELYGLFFAKKAITQEDCCILVEGYTDVISMHQAGVENVVASSGTSLTTEQIRLIARFTRNITVIYDGDPAGIKASLRGINMILAEGLNVRVVLLPDGDDPDSYSRKHSATEVREFIRSHAEDFLTFKARLLMDETGGDPVKKARLIGDMVESIAVIPDAIMRSVYIKECAASMDIDHALLINEVARKRISYSGGREARDFVASQQNLDRTERAAGGELLAGTDISAGSSMEELEKELTRYLLKYGHCDFEYKEGRETVKLNVAEIVISDLESNGIEFRNPRYKAIYDQYSSLFRTNGKGAEVPPHLFINHADPEVSNTAVELLTAEDNYVPSSMWEKHDIAVDTEFDRLAAAVPRTVILYKSKAIEAIVDSLNRRLRDESLTEEEASDIVYRISTLNRERAAISHRLGRLIL